MSTKIQEKADSFSCFLEEKEEKPLLVVKTSEKIERFQIPILFEWSGVCNRCGGWGTEKIDPEEKCFLCHGTGKKRRKAWERIESFLAELILIKLVKLKRIPPSKAMSPVEIYVPQVYPNNNDDRKTIRGRINFLPKPSNLADIEKLMQNINRSIYNSTSGCKYRIQQLGSLLKIQCQGDGSEIQINSNGNFNGWMFNSAQKLTFLLGLLLLRGD